MVVFALAFEATPPVIWKDSLVLTRSLVVGTEPSEEFTVTLTDPLNRLVLGAQNVATVRILDDDGPVKPDRDFVPAEGVSGLLAVQPDGKIFATISNRVVRLDLEGSIDPGFIPIQATNLYGWAGVSNGWVILAGDFQFVNGRPHAAIVRVQANAPALEFKSIARAPGGRVRLGLATEPGKTYQLQASVDLANWVLSGTVNGTGEMIEVEDAEAPNTPRRFCRLVETRR